MKFAVFRSELEGEYADACPEFRCSVLRRAVGGLVVDFDDGNGGFCFAVTGKGHVGDVDFSFSEGRPNDSDDAGTVVVFHERGNGR